MGKSLLKIEKDIYSLLRPAAEVMQPERIGAFRLTSISFSRSIIRKMMKESWGVVRVLFDLDYEGYGKAIYRITTPQGLFHFIVFSHKISDEERDDRANSMKWDTTFTLYEGEITNEVINRLQTELPKQRLGRGDKNCLVWSRANKSKRIFQYIIDKLSCEEQPDIEAVSKVGYILRTTAVFGNGKFGIAPLENIKENHTFSGAYRAELFSVYLIRQFSFELVEHIAKNLNPNAVTLDSKIKRYLGIGNSTGVGMVFYINKHPLLINRWVILREIALARVKLVKASKDDCEFLIKLLERCKNYFTQSSISNENSIYASSRQLASECSYVKNIVLEYFENSFSSNNLWNRITNVIKQTTCIETQELFNSLLIELYPKLILDLENYTIVDEVYNIKPEMQLKDLKHIIKNQYYWVFQYNFNLASENHYFWYRTVERDLPYMGIKGEDAGGGEEHPLDIAKQIQKLGNVLQKKPDDEKVALFLLQNPKFRYIVSRIQSLQGHFYGEIHCNLISKEVQPMYLERLKLSILGAERFSPKKTNRNIRAIFFQGAPIVEDIGTTFNDNWIFPELPK